MTNVGVDVNVEQAYIEGRNGMRPIKRLEAWWSPSGQEAFIDGIGRRGKPIKGGFGSLTLDELNAFCKAILEAHGYKIVAPGSIQWDDLSNDEAEVLLCALPQSRARQFMPVVFQTLADKGLVSLTDIPGDHVTIEITDTGRALIPAVDFSDIDEIGDSDLLEVGDEVTANCVISEIMLGNDDDDWNAVAIAKDATGIVKQIASSAESEIRGDDLRILVEWDEPQADSPEWWVNVVWLDYSKTKLYQPRLAR